MACATALGSWTVEGAMAPLRRTGLNIEGVVASHLDAGPYDRKDVVAGGCRLRCEAGMR